MRSILQQLYEGTLAPAEHYTPRLRELCEKRQRHWAHYDAFLARLNDVAPELGREFEEVMDEPMGFYPLEVTDTFIDGFRLGARMMLEILQE